MKTLPKGAIIGVEIHNQGGETMKNKIILGRQPDTQHSKNNLSSRILQAR